MAIGAVIAGIVTFLAVAGLMLSVFTDKTSTDGFSFTFPATLERSYVPGQERGAQGEATIDTPSASSLPDWLSATSTTVPKQTLVETLEDVRSIITGSPSETTPVPVVATEAATETPTQSAIRAYANQVAELLEGAYRKASAESAVLQAFFDNQSDPAARAGITALAETYQLYADTLEQMPFPEEARETYQTLVAGREGMASGLLSILASSGEAGVLQAVQNYNDSLIKETGGYALMVRLIEQTGVTFRAGEPGAIFTQLR